MLHQLRQTAADLGLPFGKREFTYNSRLAQELEKWAESKGKGDLYRRAVFNAYFVSGLNIAQQHVLLQIVTSIGLSGSQARQVLSDRRFRDEVDGDWRRSKEKGVSAVPTFRLDNDMIVGAQPLPVLEKLLKKHGIGHRKRI